MERLVIKVGPELETAIREINLRMRILKAAQQARSESEDLNDREILLLELLDKNKKMSIRQIASAYPDLSESTVSTRITRLWKEDKLVSKTIDPDNQRVTLVELTEKGKQMLNTIREQQSQLYKVFFQAINVSEEERDVLIDIFTRAVDYIDENFAPLKFTGKNE